MRILAVGNMYPPHHLGGYEIVWQAAMRRAREAGHSVRVLTTEHREPGVEGKEDPDVHRELEWYLDPSTQDWRELRPFARFAVELRNAARLRRHLAEFRPDLVSFWSMGGMSLSLVERAAATDLPSVLVVHDDWLLYGPRVDAWMRMWRRPLRAPAGSVAAALTRVPTRFAARRSERVLANSEFILRRAREGGYELPHAAVVPPGIEGRFLDVAEERPWGWRLVCVGRLDPRKGVDLAIDALARLPAEATLTIAGSGASDYERSLHAKVEELGLGPRVEFAGQVGRDELPALYGRADAVIFPVRWEEPFGLVPLEAMGIGRPVVATARGGAAEYLCDGENALVVPVDHAEAIAGALKRLADDAELRARLRKGGLETAAGNTSECFERRIVEELEAAAR